MSDQYNPALNPYQPPQVEETLIPQAIALRQQALWNVRTALLVLMVPGWTNYVCLTRYWNSPLLAAANFLGGLFIVVATWFFGLKAIDCAAVVFHHLFGERVEKKRWLDSMYAAIWPLKWVAILGAGFWFAWLYIYFFTLTDVVLLNIVFGGIGNALAACVYIPVFFQWIQLRREAGRTQKEVI